jgi:hypothetical protein
VVCYVKTMECCNIPTSLVAEVCVCVCVWGGGDLFSKRVRSREHRLSCNYISNEKKTVCETYF